MRMTVNIAEVMRFGKCITSCVTKIAMMIIPATYAMASRSKSKAYETERATMR